ncbi:MAG: hypothetical protein IJN50_06185 [Clostridia bacterium]|nr:hypothetical protein [Clostridia bacterium]
MLGISIKKIAGTINIGTFKKDDSMDIKMNEDIIEFFKNANSDEKEDLIHKKKYIIHSGLESFKAAVFECTEVLYNNEGRVYQMTFKEK